MGAAHEHRVSKFLSKRAENEKLPSLERAGERKRLACLHEHKYTGGSDCKSCSDFRVCWPSALN